MIKEGTKAPDFELESDKGNFIKLSDFIGKKVLLYFYPKDNTPGCSLEAKNFNDNLDKIAKKGIEVLGVSKDSIKSHCKFKDKYDLKFRLLSDPEHKVMEKYDVWVKKKNFGKEYMGVERSTFAIDEEGKIEKVWRKVKAKKHIIEVLDYFRIE